MHKHRLSWPAIAFAAAMCCSTAAAIDPADDHPDLHLIPWPKSLQPSAGYMRLTADSRIVVGDDRLRGFAESGIGRR